MTKKSKERAKEIAKQFQDVEANVQTPVTALKGIGGTGEKRLAAKGIYTVMDLAVCTPTELVEITGYELNQCEEYVRLAQDFARSTGIIKQSMMKASEVYEYRNRELDRLPTGSSSLDELLGNGLQAEAITEFYGLFGCGKTQICHTAATNVQLPPDYQCPSCAKKYEETGICDVCKTDEGEDIKLVNKGGLNGTVYWFDTENTFRPERIIQIAKARGYAKNHKEALRFLDGITHVRVHNVAHQIATISALSSMIADVVNDCKEGDPKPKLIIVDSLMAQFRTEMIGRGLLAPRQGKIGQYMKKLETLAETWKMICIVTNQVMSTPDGFGDPISPIGGNIVGHLSTYRIYIKRSGKKRVAKMVDSPEHAEFERIIALNEAGVVDAEDSKQEEKIEDASNEE